MTSDPKYLVTRLKTAVRKQMANYLKNLRSLSSDSKAYNLFL